MRFFKFDGLPSHLTVVAAVLGIGQEPHDGVNAPLFEKFTLFDRGEKADLFLGRQFGKFMRRWKKFYGFGVQVSQPLFVSRLLVAVKSDQCPVDEIHYVCLACSGSTVRGNDLRSDCFDFRSLLRGKELQLWRMPGCRRILRLLLCCQNGGPVKRDPRGTEGET